MSWCFLVNTPLFSGEACGGRPRGLASGFSAPVVLSFKMDLPKNRSCVSLSAGHPPGLPFHGCSYLILKQKGGPSWALLLYPNTPRWKPPNAPKWQTQELSVQCPAPPESALLLGRVPEILRQSALGQALGLRVPPCLPLSTHSLLSTHPLSTSELDFRGETSSWGCTTTCSLLFSRK